MMRCTASPGSASSGMFLEQQAAIALAYLPSTGTPSEHDQQNQHWQESGSSIAAVDGFIFKEQSLSPVNPGEIYTTMPDPAAKTFPEGLGGHFAAAVWDKLTATLWLIRDPAGIKPLFYYHGDNDLIIFASEIKSILAHPLVQAEIDEEGLTAYLTFGYIPGALSILKRISKVLPGEAISLHQNSGLKRHQYWRLPSFANGEGDIQSLAADVRAQFLKELSQHIAGHQKAGLYFSAGIDSTIVLAGLKALECPEIHTYTVGFQLKSGSERLKSDLAFAEGVAESYGAHHHTLVFDDAHDPSEALLKTWPELEVFEIGMINYAKYLLRKELLREPLYFNLLLGSLGTIPARVRDLDHMVDTVPEGASWGATGLGRFQLPMTLAAIMKGGHVRIGLEDNIFYDNDRIILATNAQLITRLAKFAKDLGRDISSPEETRKVLGIA